MLPRSPFAVGTFACESLETRRLLSGYSLTALADLNDSTGADVQSPLLRDSQGNLFGTTENGGVNSGGTLFELPTGQHQPTVLNSFTADEQQNGGGLVADQSGDIFGSSVAGGTDSVGRIFEFSNGTFFNLFFFQANNSTVGNIPFGQLLSAGASTPGGFNLFGMSDGAGPNGGGGIYELSQDPTFTIQSIAGFPARNGSPGTGLTIDSQSNLFGTTLSGGTNGDGSIFEAPAGGGVLLTLASFDGANGSTPVGLLTFDPVTGALYGVTHDGGEANEGTIFKFSNGTITTVASFSGSNSFLPNGTLVLDSNGNLFGTTSRGGANNQGTVFELPLGGKNIITLGSFDGPNFGAAPIGSLVTDGNGNLFGATSTGGPNGDGVIYELSPSPTPFLALAQRPSFGTAGVKITPPLTVYLLTAQSNLNTTAKPAKITLTATDPNGKVFHFSAVSKLGVATFKLTSFKVTGKYTFTASNPNLGSDTSTSLTIEPAAGQKLVFTRQPAPDANNAPFEVQAQVLDRFGNLATSDAGNATISLIGGIKTAVLSGTLSEPIQDGLFTFADLSIDLAVKNFKLKLVDGKLHTTSKPFAVP
jgi:uncharacterized repeat protein (TIGR03803 family)